MRADLDIESEVEGGQIVELCLRRYMFSKTLSQHNDFGSHC